MLIEFYPLILVSNNEELHNLIAAKAKQLNSNSPSHLAIPVKAHDFQIFLKSLPEIILPTESSIILMIVRKTLLSESRMRSNVAFVLGVNVYDTLLKAEKAMSYYPSRGEI